MAAARINSIPVYLLDVKVYNTSSATQYKIAEMALLEALSIAPLVLKGLEIARVRVSTIDPWRICIATIAMTPITEPTKPSRKGLRSYEPVESAVVKGHKQYAFASRSTDLKSHQPLK